MINTWQKLISGKPLRRVNTRTCKLLVLRCLFERGDEAIVIFVQTDPKNKHSYHSYLKQCES